MRLTVCIAAAATAAMWENLMSMQISCLGTKIQLKGKDLADMGFKPGPVFREIFDRVLEARLNNLIKTREDEVRFLKDHFTPNLHDKIIQGSYNE